MYTLDKSLAETSAGISKKTLPIYWGMKELFSDDDSHGGKFYRLQNSEFRDQITETTNPYRSVMTLEHKSHVGSESTKWMTIVSTNSKTEILTSMRIIEKVGYSEIFKILIITIGVQNISISGEHYGDVVLVRLGRPERVDQSDPVYLIDQNYLDKIVDFQNATLSKVGDHARKRLIEQESTMNKIIEETVKGMSEIADLIHENCKMLDVTDKYPRIFSFLDANTGI